MRCTSVWLPPRGSAHRAALEAAPRVLFGLAFLSCVRTFQKVSDKSTKKIKTFLAGCLDSGECLIMSDHRKIDTRMPKSLYDLVDGYATNQGIKRSAVVVQALEEFFGMQKKIVSPVEFARSRKILTVYPSDAPETMKAAEQPGDICELPVPGYSPAKTPIRYPKGTRRKSSS